jgi:hypothetical protein
MSTEATDKRTCCTCRYWKLAKGVTADRHETFVGLCRYHPPNPQGNVPMTFEDHLCAAWEPKPYAPDTEK